MTNFSSGPPEVKLQRLNFVFGVFMGNNILQLLVVMSIQRFFFKKFHILSRFMNPIPFSSCQLLSHLVKPLFYNDARLKHHTPWKIEIFWILQTHIFKTSLQYFPRSTTPVRKHQLFRPSGLFKNWNWTSGCSLLVFFSQSSRDWFDLIELNLLRIMHSSYSSIWCIVIEPIVLESFSVMVMMLSWLKKYFKNRI